MRMLPRACAEAARYALGNADGMRNLLRHDDLHARAQPDDSRALTRLHAISHRGVVPAPAGNNACDLPKEHLLVARMAQPPPGSLIQPGSTGVPRHPVIAPHVLVIFKNPGSGKTVYVSAENG